jgi:hypothetical protein
VFVQPKLQWKSDEYYIFWVCISCVRYPSCIAHAPCCHLCFGRLYIIFPHYLICTIFGKELFIVRFVFWFYLQFLSETFLILRRIERDMIKMCFGLHGKYQLFLSHFNKSWIFSTEFRNILQYQISCKSVQLEPSFSMQTEKHDEVDSCFSQFWHHTSLHTVTHKIRNCVICSLINFFFLGGGGRRLAVCVREK